MLVQQNTEMDGFEPKKNLALLSFCLQNLSSDDCTKSEWPGREEQETKKAYHIQMRSPSRKLTLPVA